MVNPHIVLAVYKAKPTTTVEQLCSLVREHEKTLIAEKLRTARPTLLLQSLTDASYFIEVFEWADDTASDRAHQNPKVMSLWGKFMELCDTIGVHLSDVPEGRMPFAHFRPIELGVGKVSTSARKPPKPKMSKRLPPRKKVTKRRAGRR